MFIPKLKKSEPSNLDKAIDAILVEMHSGYSEEDSKTQAETVKLLSEARAMSAKQNGVSADTLVAAGASLLGIAMIIGFEKTHVLTSKGLSLLLKPRS